MKVPLEEISFSFSKSSGPGGQNVNKVNSKATLRWRYVSSRLSPSLRNRLRELYPNRINRDGELIITSWKFRTQQENKEACIIKLQNMLEKAALPVLKRKPTVRTKTANEDRLSAKRKSAQKKSGRKVVSAEDDQ